MKYVVPAGVATSNGVIRWHYMTTNSCTSHSSAPEEFWNCADVAIADGGSTGGAVSFDNGALVSAQPQDLRPAIGGGELEGVYSACPKDATGELLGAGGRNVPGARHAEPEPDSAPHARAHSRGDRVLHARAHSRGHRAERGLRGGLRRAVLHWLPGHEQRVLRRRQVVVRRPRRPPLRLVRAAGAGGGSQGPGPQARLPGNGVAADSLAVVSVACGRALRADDRIAPRCTFRLSVRDGPTQLSGLQRGSVLIRDVIS